MEKTENKELITALCKAQAQFKSALKDAENSHFKRSYADLSAIWEACKEGLHQNGLVISQQTMGTEQGWHLVTKLFHESGGYIESLTPIICQANNPQSFGSGMTYARRYALAAILGIVTDDDDAEGAMNRKDTNVQHNAPKAPAARVQAPVKTVTNAVKELDACKGRDDMGKIWNSYKEFHGDRLFLEALERVGKKYPKKEEVSHAS
jgi:hypothetical protein